jgi:diacylglycerol kinase (ATP)
MNPRAGMMRANRHLADIISLFSTFGYTCTVCMTHSPGEAIALSRANAGDADLVVAIGGDGTFNEVVTGMLEACVSKPLGYIPAGSTNDLANSLKLSKNIIQATKDILIGSLHTLDVGCFNGRYFSYIASCGAFTKVSYSTPQLNKNTLGHAAYIMEGIKELPEIKPVRLHVEMDGQVFEGDFIFAAISNAISVAGLLTLDSKVVDMNDGRFEIMLIKFPTTPAQFMDILHALNIRNYQNDMMYFYSAEHVLIRTSKSVDWTLDGEYMQGSETIEFRAIPDAIQLMINSKKKRP